MSETYLSWVKIPRHFGSRTPFSEDFYLSFWRIRFGYVGILPTMGEDNTHTKLKYSSPNRSKRKKKRKEKKGKQKSLPFGKCNPAVTSSFQQMTVAFDQGSTLTV